MTESSRIRTLVALLLDGLDELHRASVGELAGLYGVTDLDGSQPQWYAAHRRQRLGGAGQL